MFCFWKPQTADRGGRRSSGSMGTGFFFGQHRWGEPTGNVLTVALVQGAVPQDLKWQPEQLGPTLELYQRLTGESEGSRLIIWPEAAIPALYDRVSGYLDGIREWAAERGSTVALGILKGPTQRAVRFRTRLWYLESDPVSMSNALLCRTGRFFPCPASSAVGCV
ncbi:MAG: hypothetical protein CM1200mP36_01580 [Gammaproteobacteria bacterium]|nr:MAG: hypothetical protein CM1200mP36_01580 [Gammaproteobacteria bacterium]